MFPIAQGLSGGRPSKARSVQERLRVIFSQDGPELVRVNKKFIIWLCYITWKVSAGGMGWGKRFAGKHSKLSSFISPPKNYIAQEKVKTFKETVSLEVLFKSLELFESNVLSHFLYSRFTSRALTALIMPVGITGKSGPEYWPVSGRVIYLEALAL